jgi:hypothetical protein
MGRTARVFVGLALCALMSAAAIGCGNEDQARAPISAVTMGAFPLAAEQPVRIGLTTTTVSGLQIVVQVKEEEQDFSCEIVKLDSADGANGVAPVPADASMRRRRGVDAYVFRTSGQLIAGEYRLDLRGSGQVIALDVKAF